jgi:hypothetical protein
MTFVPKPGEVMRLPSFVHCGDSSDGEDCTNKLVAPEPESPIVKVTPTVPLFTVKTFNFATIEPGPAALGEEGETAAIAQDAKMVARPCFTAKTLGKHQRKKNRMIG